MRNVHAIKSARAIYIYSEDNVACHFVPAIETSDLEQVWAVNALDRDEVYLSVLWLLGVPHLARVVSLRRVLFSFFCHFFAKRLFVRIHHVILINGHVRILVGEQVGCCPSDLGVCGSNPGWWRVYYFLWHFPLFCCSVKICTMMVEVSSEQSGSQFYMHT